MFFTERKGSKAAVTLEATRKLRSVSENVETRINDLEGRAYKKRVEAKRSLDAGNRRKALFWLKQEKQIMTAVKEMELFFLVVEQQLLSLENMAVYKSSLEVCSHANRILEKIQKGMNVEDVMEKYAELNDEMERVEDTLSSMGKNQYDEQELEEELARLVVEDLPVAPSTKLAEKEKAGEEDNLKLLELY